MNVESDSRHRPLDGLCLESKMAQYCGLIESNQIRRFKLQKKSCDIAELLVHQNPLMVWDFKRFFGRGV